MAQADPPERRHSLRLRSAVLTGGGSAGYITNPVTYTYDPWQVSRVLTGGGTPSLLIPFLHQSELAIYGN